MSDKIYRLYSDQIDRIYMEYPFAEFSQRSMTIMNAAFIDVKLLPADYMKLCHKRAAMIIAHG